MEKCYLFSPRVIFTVFWILPCWEAYLNMLKLTSATPSHFDIAPPICHTLSPTPAHPPFTYCSGSNNLLA